MLLLVLLGLSCVKELDGFVAAAFVPYEEERALFKWLEGAKQGNVTFYRTHPTNNALVPDLDALTLM